MSASAEHRDAVASRDGWACRYCGRPVVRPPAGRNHTAAEASTIATLDHWVPRCRGGADEPDNLVIACRPCNEDKGNLTGAEYLGVLAQRRLGLHLLPLPSADIAVAAAARPAWLGLLPTTSEAPALPRRGLGSDQSPTPRKELVA